MELALRRFVRGGAYDSVRPLLRSRIASVKASEAEVSDLEDSLKVVRETGRMLEENDVLRLDVAMTSVFPLSGRHAELQTSLRGSVLPSVVELGRDLIVVDSVEAPSDTPYLF